MPDWLCWTLAAYLVLGLGFAIKRAGSETWVHLRWGAEALTVLIVAAIIWLPGLLWVNALSPSPRRRNLGFWVIHAWNRLAWRGVYWIAGSQAADWGWIFNPRGERLELDEPARQRIYRSCPYPGGMRSAECQAFLKTLWEDAHP